MQIFKDRDGREWQVVLNVFQMKRIRARLGRRTLILVTHNPNTASLCTDTIVMS